MADKKNKKNVKKSDYGAEDIYILEGLDPVRKRPGMYIGSTGPDGLHHLIWEVIDNSIDEAMAGYATNILVELLPDNEVRVTDDGRGIPVEKHKQSGKSALETVMTTLHAGGKFGGESYKVSGGLHGVGVSVVNALSLWLKAEVCLEGNRYVQEYERGKPKSNVKKQGKCERNGTTVSFKPDPEIFTGGGSFNFNLIVNHLRQQAYLTKGLRIDILDKRGEKDNSYAFYFEGGLKSYLTYLIGNSNPIHDHPFYIHKEENSVDIEATFSYTDDVESEEHTFANNIYTADGGMHLTGFRSALTRTLNDYARKEGFLKDSDSNLTGEDVREGIVAAVSVKLSAPHEPQFEGQTKARLGNPEARSAVETVVNEALSEFLERYSNDAKRILEKNLLAAKARKAAKAAKDTVLRKGALEGLSLPGKLADCISRKPEESELFIVEGDSAGGCFSGDTEVALVDGRNVSFKDLFKEARNNKKNYCYTIKENGNIGIAPIKNPRVTKKNVEVVEVTLDNGKKIKCTPDHLFMLRDGSYKKAETLTKNDSLMPFRKKLSEKGGGITIEGYEMVFDSKINKWIFTHLLSDKCNLDNGVYKKIVNSHVHHKDFNKLNNNPDNLVRMNKDEHINLHREMAKMTLNRPDVRKKLREIRKTLEFREKIRKVMTTPEMKKILSKRAKKQWESVEYKNYMVKKFLEFYYSNEKYRKESESRLYKEQKRYWSDLKNRNKQSKRVSEYFKNNPDKIEELSKIAKKQWGDSQLRNWRSKKTKDQWTSDFRKKRKEAYNLTYMNKALKVLHDIYLEKKKIDIGEYNRLRRESNDKSLIRYETIRNRFFGNNDRKMKEAVVNYNHRVVGIKRIHEKIDVYDLEVEKTHNFALSSGVFVHNSAKGGRDKKTQAILPLRGKILNVEKARIDRMLKNKEIRALIIALGTAIGEEFDVSKLRYHKVIIMTDADVDGAHIRTLLLTLFYRYFREIIEQGYLYIAQPPLYQLNKGKKVEYAYNNAEYDKLVKEMGKNVNVQRYKGLGEMNPDRLWATTMNPENRVLKRVTVKDAAEADNLFDVLMGEEVAPRKKFIQAHAKGVKNLDI
jgi:DNA gyrase subunit B